MSEVNLKLAGVLADQENTKLAKKQGKNRKTDNHLKKKQDHNQENRNFSKIMSSGCEAARASATGVRGAAPRKFWLNLHLK